MEDRALGTGSQHTGLGVQRHPMCDEAVQTHAGRINTNEAMVHLMTDTESGLALHPPVLIVEPDDTLLVCERDAGQFAGY